MATPIPGQSVTNPSTATLRDPAASSADQASQPSVARACPRVEERKSGLSLLAEEGAKAVKTIKLKVDYLFFRAAISLDLTSVIAQFAEDGIAVAMKEHQSACDDILALAAKQSNVGALKSILDAGRSEKNILKVFERTLDRVIKAPDLEDHATNLIEAICASTPELLVRHKEAFKFIVEHEEFNQYSAIERDLGPDPRDIPENKVLNSLLELPDESGTIAQLFEAALCDAIEKEENLIFSRLLAAITRINFPLFSKLYKEQKTFSITKLIKAGRQEIAKQILDATEYGIIEHPYDNIAPTDHPFHAATVNGDLDLIRWFLRPGKTPRRIVRNHALFEAIKKGNRDAIKLFLSHSSECCRTRTKEGITPIQYAIALGRSAIAEDFLNCWTPDSANDLQALILMAARMKMTSVVEHLACTAARANKPGLSAFSIFRETVLAGATDYLQVLHDAGLTLTSEERARLCDSVKTLSSSEQETILHGKLDLAGMVERNSTYCALRHLQTLPKDALAAEKEAIRWLYIAARNGNSPLCRALLAAGAPPGHVTKRNGKTDTALFHMIRNADTENALAVISAMRKSGRSDFDLQDHDGNTALILAAKMNNVDVVRELLAANADADIENDFEEDALGLAIRLENENMLAELLPKCQPNNYQAETLLAIAIMRGTPRILEMVARKCSTILKDDKTVFRRVIRFSPTVEVAYKLIDSGIEPSEEVLQELSGMLFTSDEIKKIRRHVPPLSPATFNALQRKDFATLGEIPFTPPPITDDNPLALHPPYDEPWLQMASEPKQRQSNGMPDTRLFRLKPGASGKATHPVALFLASRNPLRASEDVQSYLGGWHPAVIAALEGTRCEKEASLAHLKEILGDHDLGLCLVDDNAQTILQMTPENEATLEAQLQAVAISQNAMLHELVRSDPPSEPGVFATSEMRKEARNRRAQWVQASALLHANTAYRPFRIGLRNPRDIASVEAAVREKHISVADALYEIEGLLTQSDRFLQVLDSGLPETLLHWLGNEVVPLLDARRGALEAARGRLESLARAT